MRQICISKTIAQSLHDNVLYRHWKKKKKLLYPFSDTPVNDSQSCTCSVPCIQQEFDATITNALLDMLNLQREIQENSKSVRLLPKMQTALDLSAHVRQVHVYLTVKGNGQ